MVSQEEVKDVVILTPQNSILHEEIERMENIFENLLKKGKVKVVLDLSKVTHTSSSTLGLLVAAKKKFQNQGGDIKLVVVSDELKQIIEITMLDHIFEIYSSRNNAIEAFL